MTARTAWQIQSLLIDYPDARLRELLPAVAEAVTGLPEAVAAPLGPFLAHAAATAPTALEEAYVATFDHRKRFSPYLTYFACGDTRKRGMALLRFKHAYRAHGMELGEGELPDHLAVVLEFAATGDARTGLRLLSENRAGLELLRRGLREDGSPWAGVLDSVDATLPPLTEREREAALRLALDGPPAEEVGLAPFAPGEYMPSPAGGTR